MKLQIPPKRLRKHCAPAEIYISVSTGKHARDVFMSRRLENRPVGMREYGYPVYPQALYSQVSVDAETYLYVTSGSYLRILVMGALDKSPPIDYPTDFRFSIFFRHKIKVREVQQ